MSIPRLFKAPRAIPTELKDAIKKEQDIRQREIETNFSEKYPKEFALLKQYEALANELQKLNEARSNIVKNAKAKTYYFNVESSPEDIKKLREITYNAATRPRPDLLSNVDKIVKPKDSNHKLPDTSGPLFRSTLMDPKLAKERSHKLPSQYIEDARQVIAENIPLKEIDTRIKEINNAMKRIPYEEINGKLIEKENAIKAMQKTVEDEYLNKQKESKQPKI